MNFIIGCIMIWIALPMVWMNERKQVKIDKLINNGREAVKSSQFDGVIEEHNFELVHTSGEVTTENPIGDQQIEYMKEQCVKLKRDVQVYQWVEERVEEGENVRYNYST